MDSVNGMVSAVVKLLGDPEKRLARSLMGRNRVEDKHDWEKITSLYERVYESVVKHSSQTANRQKNS